MMKTLFLNPPSFEGFDGGAGSRYQARREIRSFWYPTWLAQPAALVPESKLLDCPPHDIGVDECIEEARNYDHVIIHTSTPSLKNDCRVAETIKQQNPKTVIGFVGAHAAVLPRETLAASKAVDWAGGREFDYTCREVAQGRPLSETPGLSYRDGERLIQNPERKLIQNLDELPWVTDVYKRDLDITKYSIGYLKEPYVSFYTGRGCPARCTFCLWPQTIAGRKYRVRSPESVAAEMAHAQKIFPQAKEFFFDDDTFTANPPRAREVARLLKPMGITWSCNSRANVGYETLKTMKHGGLRLLLVGYESGNREILKNIKKGVTLEQAREFTRYCKELGIIVHGTFVLGLPVETKETIKETLEFAKELDVFSIQVSLAAPYPGTELYETAKQNGWLSKDYDTSIIDDGIQQCALEYPELSKEEIFESIERFYKQYYFRPRPIWRIIKTMLKDKDVFARRIREGYEFFNFMWRRKHHGTD
ncbi:MAG: hopanoid biosynthesis associated radical SAM protein HpnJ [Verrucomicrobia bacterium]|nr:hopanoid biosynthesis associated radical SAM protein HpnJ [Verrucomicrobiota bacterium]